jgi:hypothetical protein
VSERNNTAIKQIDRIAFDVVLSYRSRVLRASGNRCLSGHGSMAASERQPDEAFNLTANGMLAARKAGGGS